jgi:hypothetical protein
LLIFYGPLTLWSGGWWLVAAIVAASLLAPVLTHRYRVVGMGPVRRRVDRTLFALGLIYSGWVLIIGIASLVYVISGSTT